MTRTRRRPYLCRGSFARLMTWEDVLRRCKSVRRNNLGTFARFSNGFTVYKQYRNLNGMYGVVVDVSPDGDERQIRLQNRQTVWVPVELIEPVVFQYDERGVRAVSAYRQRGALC